MATIRVGAKAIILRDRQVLLIKYVDASGEHYNFPGGGIQSRESIRKGLRREVYEETNLRVKVGRLLLVGEYEPRKHKRAFGRTHKLTLYFLCTEKEPGGETVPPKPDNGQIGVEWCPLEQLPESLLPLHHDLILAALDDETARNIFTTRA